MAASLRPGDGAVAEALALCLTFVGRAGLGDDVADRLAIVVEEWVLNIIEHGAAPEDSVIELSIDQADAHVRICVADSGTAFDPRTAVPEGPNLERGGGAGLALIQAWTRIASYRRHQARNEVVFELPVAV